MILPDAVSDGTKVDGSHPHGCHALKRAGVT